MKQLPINYNEAHFTERRLVREQYARLQQGVCWHCGTLLTDPPAAHIQSMQINKRLFPPSFFKWPVHLHHDHDTGLTIGAVHNTCNAVLWQHHGQ